MAKYSYSQDELDKVKQYVLDFYDASSDFVEPYFEAAIDSYRDYKCYLDPNDEDYKYQTNQLFLPLSMRFIDTAGSKILNQLVKGDKYITVQGVSKEYETTAKYVEHYHNFVLNNRINFFYKLWTMIRTNLIYGVSYGKTFWNNYQPTVRRRVPVKVLGRTVGFQEKAEKVTVQHNPDLEIPDIFRIYPDPRGTNPQDTRGIIDRYTVDYDRFMAQVEDDDDFFNLDQIKAESTPVWKDDWREKKAAAIGKNVPKRTHVENLHGKKYKHACEIEVMDYWGLYEYYDIDTKERMLQQGVTTIVNREVVVRHRASPYYHCQLPILKTVDNLEPHEWFGRGVCEINKAFQKYINKSTNQRLDNLDLALNVMWLVSTGAVTDERELVSRAGGIVHVNGNPQTSVIPLRPNDVSIDSLREYKVIKDESEQSVGVPSYAMGVPSSRLNDTATGISAIIQQAMDRFATKIFCFAKDIIEPMAYQNQSLMEQFMLQKELIRVEGKEYLEELKLKPADNFDDVGFFEISPDQVIGRYNFRCAAGAFDSPISLKQERLLRFAQIGLTPQMIDYINPEEFLRQIADLLEVKETNKLIKDKKEIQMIQMIRMKQQMAEAQATEAQAQQAQSENAMGGEPEIREVGQRMGNSIQQ